VMPNAAVPVPQPRFSPESSILTRKLDSHPKARFSPESSILARKRGFLGN
jgi:hypothetical protein